VELAEPGGMAIPMGDVPALLESEHQAADAELQRVFASAFPQGAPADVETRLVEDDPGPALVEAASDADLLVVGSHGRGRVASALMGSVSSHVVHHARCPVVVVKAVDAS